jgi:alpha-L-rhamnosidase
MISSGTNQATSELNPVDPRCEYLVNPLGIDVRRPRLSWVFATERHGARQSAYQILAARTPDTLAAGRGDCWDSGRVDGADSVHVVYDGPELESGERVWWRVRVWDEQGRGPFESVPAWWEMGLLKPGDWTGRWISLPSAVDEATSDRSPSQLPCPYLRATFTLTQPVTRARLYATARGLYDAHLNGQRVGDALLAPGWTDYASRIQYQTYDVTDLLHQGPNRIGAMLGAGWYCGRVGFLGAHSNYGRFPELLVQLVVEHPDGVVTVVSDASWEGMTGPILAADLLMGETYDARAELPGWDHPAAGRDGWSAVRVSDRDQTPLVADRAEPVRVVEEIAPRSLTVRDDHVIVDMGQLMTGWVRLRAAGPAGTRIQLRFAEVLNPDGSIYTENLRGAAQTDVVILRGAGDEVFEPRFTFHGFRYVEVSGYPGDLTPERITGRVVESATERTGSFSCSSDMLNQLQRNIVWGQRGNFLSIPTDCPQRDERLGWLADAQVFARTACFNAGVAAFFTKWLDDVADAQSAEGAFSDVAPRLVDLADGAPAWGDGGVIVPWILYLCYGDRRLIETHYDGMTRWLAYLERHNPDLLWKNRRNNDFGDWLAIGAETPKELIGTAFFAADARLLARMARIIDRAGDAARYDALADRIAAAFVDAYVTPDGRVQGETQTGYALSLQLDLLPVDLRPAAARHLAEDVERRGGQLSTGFVGVSHLCPALTENGHVETAYRVALSETYPSWGYMIRHGATTIWERWDGWTDERGFQDPGMNSFNHYAFGSIGDWLYRYVAGLDVDPARPGYEHVVMRPYPGGGLTWAQAEYQSVRGRIASAWQIEDGMFLLDVTIPANTTATIAVPTAAPTPDRSTADDSTLETLNADGDGQVTAPEDARFMRWEPGRAVYAVDSGRYTFRSRLSTPAP